MEFTSTAQILPEWAVPLVQKTTDVIFKNPRPVITVALLLLVSHITFKKIIEPQLYEYYKSILRYEATLQLLKDSLEDEYEDCHWDDPEFCKAYLSLYAAYRELRMTAKRDYNGRIKLYDERWVQFDSIKFART